MVDAYSGASSLFSLCSCFWVLFVPVLHQVTLLSYNSSTLEWLLVFWNPTAPANYPQLFRQNSFTKAPMGCRSASMFIGLVQRFSTAMSQEFLKHNTWLFHPGHWLLFLRLSRKKMTIAIQCEWNQYTFLLLSDQQNTFFGVLKIVIISLSVPLDEKGWKITALYYWQFWTTQLIQIKTLNLLEERQLIPNSQGRHPTHTNAHPTPVLWKPSQEIQASSFSPRVSREV